MHFYTCVTKDSLLFYVMIEGFYPGQSLYPGQIELTLCGVDR